MSDTLRFLVEHGYLVLFLLVLAEQLGLPIPAVPVLLGAGTLAGMGQLDAWVAVGVATVASMVADGFWYWLGAARGGAVLRHLCRISLEPDSCVRSTEGVFARYGGRSLLIAKFVPGLNTVAPPMAGITRMPLARFLGLDGAGSLLYVGLFIAIGLIWSDEIEAVAESLAAVGGRLPLLLGLLLLAYIAIKFLRRWLFLRQLRVARITPDELKARMDSGEDVVVIDLRHDADFDASRVTIPGAIRIALEAIESDHERIPRDREIVLFCT